MANSNPDNSQSDSVRGFKIKDPISFAFSSLAIILTLINIYLSNFRVVNDLSVRTVKCQIEKDSTGNNLFYITFAFINSGNHEAIISDATYYLSETPDFKESEKPNIKENPKYHGRFEENDLIPFSLAPKQTKLVTLCISTNSIIEYRNNIKIKKQLNYCAYRFSAIDSGGKEHQKSTESDLIFTDQDGTLEVDFFEKQVRLAKVYQIFED